jgi:hypothetical protein
MLRKRGWLEGLGGQGRDRAAPHGWKSYRKMPKCHALVRNGNAFPVRLPYFVRQLATVMNTLSFLPGSRKVTV